MTSVPAPQHTAAAVTIHKYYNHKEMFIQKATFPQLQAFQKTCWYTAYRLCINSKLPQKVFQSQL